MAKNASHDSAECPTGEELERLARGSMDPGEAAAIDSHLSSCTVCNGRLSSLELSGSETLLHEQESPAATRFLSGDNATPATDSFELTSEVPDQPRRLGHFELVELLGKGSFGSVWRAIDTQLEREVAIKVPRQQYIDADGLDAFHREARATAQLKHPNIASVHEVGREGQMVYIVSDLVDGVSLGAWIKSNAGNITEQKASELCRLISLALHHAHTAGVIHRDLKPGNIMLDARSQPIVLDFGLAKRVSGEATLTEAGTILGTPLYMSPEQAAGEAHQVDRRTDIYSIGVIFYELLTGHRPFRGATRMLLHQVLHEEPQSPRQLNSQISKDAETVCLRCLEKDRESRYATAEELASDLQRLINKEPVKARPIGGFTRFVRWCRRHPAVSTLSGVVLALLVAVAVGATYVASALQGKNDELETQLVIQKKKNIEVLELTLDRALESTDTGRRFESLQRIRDLSALYDDIGQPQPDLLRTQAIRALSLFDLQAKWKREIGPRITVAVDPQRQRMAVTRLDGTVEVRDLKTGETLFQFRCDQGSYSFVGLQFDPTGQYLSVNFFCTGGHVGEIWDVRSESRVASRRARVANSPLHPTQPLACFCRADSVEIWDYEKKKVVQRIEVPNAMTMVRFSNDGTRLAMGSENYASLLVYEWEASKLLKTINQKTHSVAMAWSLDDRLLVSGLVSGKIVIVDLATGKEIVLPVHTSGVVGCEFQSESRLVTSSMDGTVRVTDIVSRKLLALRPGVYFSLGKDGRRIATLEGEELHEWQVSEPVVRHLDMGNRLEAAGGGHPGTAVSPNGRLAAGTDGADVQLWDTSTGRNLATLPTTDCADLHFVDDETLATYGSPGVWFWNLNIEEAELTVGPPELFSDLVDGPRYRFVRSHALGSVVASEPQRSRFSVIPSDRPLWRFHLREPGGGPSELAVSPDGKWIATTSWGRAETVIWSTSRRRIVKRIRTGGTGNRGFSAMSFSPDGGLLGICVRTATAGSLQLWSTEDWQQVARHEYDREAAFSAPMFSPDSQSVAVPVAADAVALLRVSDGTELARFTTEERVEPIPTGYSDDGRLLAIRSSGRRVHLWNLFALREKLSDCHQDWSADNLPAVTSYPALESGKVVGGRLRLTPDRMHEEIAKLDALVRNNERDADAWYKLSLWHYAGDTWNWAVDGLNRFLPLRAESKTGHFLAGRASRGQADWKSAEAALRTERLKASLNHFRRHLELVPDDNEARLDAGEVAFELGDFDAAIEVLSPALTSDSNYPVSRLVAESQLRSGQYSKAETTLANQLEEYPRDAELLRLRAWNRLVQDDKAAASNLFAAALKHEPDNPNALRDYCLFQLATGNKVPSETMSRCLSELRRYQRIHEARVIEELGQVGSTETADAVPPAAGYEYEWAKAALRLLGEPANLPKQAEPADVVHAGLLSLVSDTLAHRSRDASEGE